MFIFKNGRLLIFLSDASLTKTKQLKMISVADVQET